MNKYVTSTRNNTYFLKKSEERQEAPSQCGEFGKKYEGFHNTAILPTAVAALVREEIAQRAYAHTPRAPETCKTPFRLVILCFLAIWLFRTLYKTLFCI